MNKKIGISILASVAFLSTIILAPLIANATNNSSNAPVAVSAQNYEDMSIDELQALIKKLQKIVEEKKNVGDPCFVVDADLSIGDGEDSVSREHVKRLQEFLREKGFFTYKTSTGYFGRITHAAISAYQKSAGLEQTGKFDAATRAMIHSSKCQLKIFAKTAKEAVKEYSKKQVQEHHSGAVLSINITVNGDHVSWATAGNSQEGYKVVWSKTSDPTYPTREGDEYIYLSKPSASTAQLHAFDGSGTYYVRVCEYVGGKCGVYSNQLTAELTK